MTADQVAATLAAVEASLAPADPRLVAIELEISLEPWGVPANWESVAGQYLEVFDDVPPDLVELACYRMRRIRFPGFPRPAEIRALILDELGERKRAFGVLKLAKRRARPPEPEWQPPSEDDKRVVTEKLATIVAAAHPRTGRSAPAEVAPISAEDRRRMTVECAQIADRMRRLDERDRDQVAAS